MKSIFKSSLEAKKHAALNVAIGWLKFSQRVIARGDNPAKLSKCGYNLAREELDRDIYRAHKIPAFAVRDMAIRQALSFLNSGEFPEVREYFQTKVCGQCGVVNGAVVVARNGLCLNCRELDPRRDGYR